jgi:hypothetical protein
MRRAASEALGKIDAYRDQLKTAVAEPDAARRELERQAERDIAEAAAP